MNLAYTHFYLVGIKGVAMTSLAQLLLDSGRHVSGSDVPEDFITATVLSSLDLHIDTTFEAPFPPKTECIIYTGAHNGAQNSQVQRATAMGYPVFTQAEALSWFFNPKRGVAVCGVGGKSTVSAMITWILEKNGKHPSYSVGVGAINGMEKTGRWINDSEFFVAEADEYVTNPSGVQKGEPAIPRFSYLHPFVTVCTHIQFDHPDVYKDESDTVNTFNTFFQQIRPDGSLVLSELDTKKVTDTAVPKLTVGTSQNATLTYTPFTETTTAGITTGEFVYQGTHYPVKLQVPGVYNLENAAYATLASLQCDLTIEQAISALADFQSTSRRFEQKGEWNGVKLYDDYAHHPTEITAVLQALYQWFPTQRVLVAFQPHTFSRTKSLFTEFVTALSAAKELVLLDIFASARESSDPDTSSQLLAQAIETKTKNSVLVLANYPELAEYCKEHLQPGDILITLGAGDIYKAHELLAE